MNKSEIQSNEVSVSRRVGAGLLAAGLAFGGAGFSRNNKANAEIRIPGEMPSQKEINLIEQQEIEVVNQRFADFLAGEGDYTEKVIERKLMYRNNKRRDLGLYGTAFGDTYMVQAIFLHHEDADKSQCLALGIKDKNGERKIVLAEWPTKLLLEVDLLRIGIRSGNTLKGLYFDTEEEALKHLSELTGKLFSFSFMCNISSDIPPGEYYLNYKNYLDSSIPNNNNLLANLLLPDKKDLNLDDKKIVDQVKNVKTSIVKISDLSEMLENIKSERKFPVTFAFSLNNIKGN